MNFENRVVFHWENGAFVSSLSHDLATDVASFVRQFGPPSFVKVWVGDELISRFDFRSKYV